MKCLKQRMPRVPGAQAVPAVSGFVVQHVRARHHVRVLRVACAEGADSVEGVGHQGPDLAIRDLGLAVLRDLALHEGRVLRKSMCGRLLAMLVRGGLASGSRYNLGLEARGPQVAVWLLCVCVCVNPQPRLGPTAQTRPNQEKLLAMRQKIQPAIPASSQGVQKLPNTCPTFTEQLLREPSFRPKLAQNWAMLAKLGQHLADIDQHWPMWATCGRSGPNLATFWPVATNFG